MKTLLLMRHAKSSHDEEGLSDHERPLNDRGRRDAPLMARRLVDSGRLPDRLLVSTARRAAETAELVVSASGFDGPMSHVHALYHATAAGILAVVADSGGDASRLMVVGHNPGMEQLVRTLTGSDDAMPTAAIAIIELPVETWEQARRPISGTLVEFWTPKDD